MSVFDSLFVPNRDVIRQDNSPPNWTLMKRMMWVRSSLVTIPTWETVTGNPVSFTTLHAAPLRQLSVAFSPVQEGSGDPSPDNVRAISGYSALNVAVADSLVFDPSTDTVSQGTINGSTGMAGQSNFRIYTSTFMPVLPNGKYTVYTNLPYFYVHEYSSDSYEGYIGNSGEWITTPSEFTTTANTHYIRIVLAISKSSSGTRVAPEDLEYLDIIPDGGRVIPITIPTPPGTVYGGTLDVLTGVLTVDRASKDLGSFTGDRGWVYDSTYHRFNAKLPTNAKISHTARKEFLMCSMFQPIMDMRPVGNIPDMAIYRGTQYDISIHDSTYTDVEQFKTAVTGQTIVYELATPLTYTLTPQEVSSLLGQNVIWSNANGDLTVEYRSN